MSHVQGIPSLKVCQSPTHPNPNSQSFRATGVLMSAKSAAIGLPILVWMFSISPMPKVCHLAVPTTGPVHNPCPLVESFNGCGFCKVLLFCKRVLISFTDRTGNSNSGLTPILQRTWLRTRTQGGQDVVEHRLVARFPRSRQPTGGLSTLSTRSPYPQSTRASSALFHHPPG
jgi:hypothetical protein